MSKIFGYKGRVNRAKFFLYGFGLLLAYFVSSLLLSTLVSMAGFPKSVMGGVSIVLFAVWLLFASFVAVKRFHDTGSPGWYFFLSLIPLVNLYFGFYLLWLRKGDDGSNRYGPDPLKSNSDQIESGRSEVA